MNPHDEGNSDGGMGVVCWAGAVAMIVLALWPGVLKAQQEETPGAPTVSLPDRPCVPEDEIDALGHFTGYRVRPVLLDAGGAAWVVISDAAGHSPPLLGFLWPEHKLFCAIAHGTDKQL